MSEPSGVDAHSTLPLDQLGSSAGGDTLRRDQYGRLWVAMPDAPYKEVGYTRVTTVAKATDEGGGLMPWKATQAVCGTLTHRNILAQWEALIAADRHPWYAGEESKAACKRLVEEAAEAGGGSDRREQGTALHAITALVDRGETPHHLSDETQRDIAAYQAKLAEAGVEIVPDMIEVTVVLDDWEVAGTFDRLIRVPGYDLPLIADLKTGADISYSDGAFATQIATYAHANAIYEQGPTGSTSRRLPMPPVDQSIGVVIWLPAGTGRCELFAVDLEAGWEGFELAYDVRRWRRRKGLRVPFSSWVKHPSNARAARGKVVAANVPLRLVPSEVGGLDKLIEEPTEDVADVTEITAAPSAAESLAALLGGGPEPERSAVEDEPSADTQRFEAEELVPEFHVEAGDLTPEIRAWLQGRIEVIGQAGDKARTDLAFEWPRDVPTLRNSDEHSPDQLAAIERAVDAVEAAHSIPFGPPKPGFRDEVMRRVLAAFPGSEVVTE